MAYNVTQRDQEKAAGRDTAIKLKQENKVMSSIVAGYFLPISRDFTKTYSATGALPNLNTHNQNLNNILNKNYKSTADKFNNQVRTALGQPENAEEINEQIDITGQQQQEKDVFISGQSIAATTHKSLNNAVTKVLIGAALAGIALTHKQVARKAKTKFRSDYKGRLPVIAMTQTQQASEGAKYGELNTLDRNNAVFSNITPHVTISNAMLTKTWIPILDSRTRPAHAAADSQTVPFDEPYTVGGQKLRYPGDTSLGATVGNTINCRCSSIKTIKRN